MHSYNIYLLSKGDIEKGDWVIVNDKIKQSSIKTVGFKIIETTDKSIFDIVSNGDPNPNDTTQIFLKQPSNVIIKTINNFLNMGISIEKIEKFFQSENIKLRILATNF